MRLQKDTLNQLIRYGLIGISLNGFAFFLYLVLTRVLGFNPMLVVAVLYPVSVIVSYILNRTWAFGHSGRVSRSLFRFLLTHVGGYFLNLSLLWVFWTRMGYPHEWVQGLAIFIVAAYLFLVFRFFVFRSIQDTIELEDNEPRVLESGHH